MGLLDDAQNLASGSDPASQEALQISQWEDTQLREFVSAITKLGIPPQQYRPGKYTKRAFRSPVPNLLGPPVAGWKIARGSLAEWRGVDAGTSYSDMPLIVTIDGGLVAVVENWRPSNQLEPLYRHGPDIQQPFHEKHWDGFILKFPDHHDVGYALTPSNKALECGTPDHAGGFGSHNLACYLKVALVQYMAT